MGYAELLPGGGMRLLIGIADVDVVVKRGSALDLRAMHNTTSVYTGVDVYPMLPREISTGLTSLNQDADRAVMVIEIVFDGTGMQHSRDVYRAVVRNKAKLAYDTVGAWLEGSGAVPELVARTPGLEAQLWLQDRIASTLKTA